MKTQKIVNVLMIGMILITSCKKFVAVDGSETTINSTDVYSNNTKATAALSYIYYDLIATDAFAQGYGGISALTGMSSDEINTYSSQLTYKQFNLNTLQTDNPIVLSFWSSGYTNLYRANFAMENVIKSTGITPAVKNQLIGEAKFMRAFLHFYLSGLYGAIPLAMNSDYRVNTSLGRSPVGDVYKSVIADLIDAQSLLTDEYLSGANEITASRIRPNKAAATALLSKVYLYSNDWMNAEKQSSLLISNPVYKLESIDGVFKSSSKEAIWSLQPAGTTLNYTQEGANFNLTTAPSPGFNNSYVITPQLLSSFEPNDLRRSNWIGSLTSGTNIYYFPQKYKSGPASTAISENLMMFRLGEQYLIRAEARANLGKIIGSGSAASDLEEIRTRAGLTLPITATTLPDIMIAIEQERKVELFTEWGNRWMDLRRWKGVANPGGNRADEVMPQIMSTRGGSWSAYKTLYPIPVTEISKNSSLYQNTGYGL